MRGFPMENSGDEQQEVKAEAVASAAPAQIEPALRRLPQSVRRALGWCAITLAVALIFSLSSLAAWWPR